MSDAPVEKVNERWRAFLATGGLSLLKRVLGKRELFLQLPEGQLTPDLKIGFWPALKLAEKI